MEPSKARQLVNGQAELELGLPTPEPSLASLVVLREAGGMAAAGKAVTHRRNPVHHLYHVTHHKAACLQVSRHGHTRDDWLHRLLACIAGGMEEEADPWSREGEERRHFSILGSVLASLRTHNT